MLARVPGQSHVTVTLPLHYRYITVTVCLGSHTRWNRRTALGGGPLEPPRLWRGAQWPGPCPGSAIQARPEGMQQPSRGAAKGGQFDRAGLPSGAPHLVLARIHGVLESRLAGHTGNRCRPEEAKRLVVVLLQSSFALCSSELSISDSVRFSLSAACSAQPCTSSCSCSVDRYLDGQVKGSDIGDGFGGGSLEQPRPRGSGRPGETARGLYSWECRAAQSHQARPEEVQEPSWGAAKGSTRRCTWSVLQHGSSA